MIAKMQLNANKGDPYECHIIPALDIITKENDVSLCYFIGKRGMSEIDPDDEIDNIREWFTICHKD